MNLPVCGYLSLLINGNIETFWILPIVLFGLGLIVFKGVCNSLKEYYIQSLILSFLLTIIIFSFYFFLLSSYEADQYQFNQFTHDVEKIEKRKSNDDVNIFAKKWKECSLEDGKLSIYEYEVYTLVTYWLEKKYLIKE